MSEREFPPDEQSERIAKQIVDGIAERGGPAPTDIGPDVLGGIGMTFHGEKSTVSIGVRNGYNTASLVYRDPAGWVVRSTQVAEEAIDFVIEHVK